MFTRSFRSVAANTARVLFFAVALPASWASAQSGGVTHIDTVPAPSLRNNLVGDPDRRAMTIYLPPSYSTAKYRRYPVVYLLHGFSATHRVFIKGPYQNINIRLSMDSLIRAGALKEMIVVTPDARNVYDGSFYTNSPATGNWEDFIVHDLVSFVDKHYRTIPKASARGIVGHSMGGFGAFRVGMRHPETFSAIYMLSAYGLAIGENLKTIPAKGHWNSALNVTDRSQVLKAGFNADLDIATAAIYSPDVSNPPLYLDFPYRREGDSLVVVDSVAARWRDTPIALVPRYVTTLKKTAIAFDAGTRDGFPDIPANVTRLDSLFTSLGIAHTAELYDGDHISGIRARLEKKALPFFSERLH